jgi:branched-chain amino acid transport system substrate-binding protein
MMRWSRLFFIAVLVLLVSEELYAVAQETRTLKIGAIFSVTGGANLLGDPEKKTVQMVVDKVNDTGGINGYPLEVLIEDDQTDATKAVSLAQKMISKDRTIEFGMSSTKLGKSSNHWGSQPIQISQVRA